MVQLPNLSMHNAVKVHFKYSENQKKMWENTDKYLKKYWEDSKTVLGKY